MISKKLISRLNSFLPREDFEQVMKGYSDERICSFRINTLKSNESEVESILHDKNIPFIKLPFPQGAYTIYKEDEFALKGTDVFYGGKIYLQGLTSQMPANFLELKDDQYVFDVTAAPGSKTTQIAALMNNTGTIVACEKHQIRYDKLCHNIALQGATNIETHKMDAMKLMEELEPESFDAILLDVPCSAEGRIKLSDERTYGFWTLKNIYEKAILQTTLLEASVRMLKKWGVLVYSTCTLAPEENEGVISSVLAKHPDLKLEAIDIADMPLARAGLQSFEGTLYNRDIGNTVRILPSNLTEGFYLAKIRKVS